MKYMVDRKVRLFLLAAKGSPCTGNEHIECRFGVETSRLDSRRFIIEHVEVVEKLQELVSKNSLVGSCEQVAVTLAQTILPLLKIPKSGVNITFSITRASGATLIIEGTGTEIAHAQGAKLVSVSDNIQEAPPAVKAAATPTKTQQENANKVTLAPVESKEC